MSAGPGAPAPLAGAALALAGFATFSWHDALIKRLGDYSSFQIIFFAMLFGAVPFLLTLATQRQAVSLLPRRPAWVYARTATAVAGMCLAFFAFSRLPMVEVYVLLFTAPALISLLAVPVLGERIQWVRALAIGLGLLGVLVVLRPSPQSMAAGHLAAAGAALCIAISSLISRKIGAGEHAGTLIVYPLLANVALCGVAMIGSYRPMPLPDLATCFAIGLLAMLGQWLMVRAYRGAPAAFVAPMQYSQLLWAVLIGALCFEEYPDRWTLLGAGLIVLSGSLIVWREATVSSRQPWLGSRNLRAVAAPPLAPARECDAGD